MFTGLVQAVGTVVERVVTPDGARLRVDLGALPGPFRLGDSIALSGVCCTVIGLDGKVAAFDLSSETLARTWLGRVGAGDRLNLEGALRAGDPLGGHLVQGHVDGVGEVVGALDPAAGGWLWAKVPA
jgi:riboflavin synthase